MKFELTATDARHGREPQPGPAADPGSGRRPAPVTARLQVTPWIASGFDVPLAANHVAKIANLKSQI
jgi:hypothetical protein